ncbi:MAG: EamA family transporter [Geminicoccaceae bacterium]|nr:MAG: EamA family transporter [Geminicoccaceae bacterium]
MDATRRATLIGFGAVLLWALLAPLAVLSDGLPPFLTTGLAFVVVTAVGLLDLARRGESWRRALAPRPVNWLFATAGLFGFHAFYFTALRVAPPVEASLIIYLWPLHIVLLQALLPGGSFTVRHVVGALMGLGGTAVLLTREAAPAFADVPALGYITAVAAGLTWAGYSVLNHRVNEGVATDAVTGFCAATAVLALLCHLLFEPTAALATRDLVAVLLLGLGPVGLAFFLWDYGTKHGDLRMLGVSAYAAPLLSTVILVAMGLAPLTFGLALAAALIVGGAAWASDDLWQRGRDGPMP